eukprot:104606_1
MSADIICCSRCNQAISQRDWDLLNVQNFVEQGYVHNCCTSDQHDTEELFENEYEMNELKTTNDQFIVFHVDDVSVESNKQKPQMEPNQFEEEIDEKNCIETDKNENEVEDKKCVIKFKYWLCQIVGLKQYMSLFIKSQDNDIRMVPYFDEDMIRNDVGINKKGHLRLILDEVNEFRKMQTVFNEWLIQNKLTKYQQDLKRNGILILTDLRRDIQNKKDLKVVFGLEDDNRTDIIWDAVHPQQYNLIIQNDVDDEKEQKDDTIADDKLYETARAKDCDVDDEKEQKSETIEYDILYETPKAMDCDGDKNTVDTVDTLQFDLEHYMEDQREMEFNHRDGGKRRKNGMYLERLCLFHRSREQVFKDWISLKNELDVLLKQIGHCYDSYSFLFDVIIGCYNVMQREYRLMSNTCKQNEKSSILSNDNNDDSYAYGIPNIYRIIGGSLPVNSIQSMTRRRKKK